MASGGSPAARRAMAAFVAEVEELGGSPWVAAETIGPWQRGTAVDMNETGS
jgi:hypothetical protein